MKTSRLTLAEWVSDAQDLDIDWPQVQRTLGIEQLQWLLSQQPDHCQLVVDQQQSHHCLVAEFYTVSGLREFLNLWGADWFESTCEAGVRRFFRH